MKLLSFHIAEPFFIIETDEGERKCHRMFRNFDELERECNKLRGQEVKTCWDPPNNPGKWSSTNKYFSTISSYHAD